MSHAPLQILLALCLALTACGDGGTTPSKGGKKSEEAPSTVRNLPPMEVGAIELHRAYAQSRPDGPKHHAWKVYRGRTIKITGRIARRAELLGTVEIALDGGGNDTEVICTAAPDKFESLRALDVGQKVALLGVGDGWSGGPHLRDCQLADQ